MHGKRIVDRSQISREEWLEWRMKGIGGGDAPAVLGVDPFTSPFSLYCYKLGITEPKEETERMEWGNILEPIVADQYAKKTARELKIEPFILQHPEFPFALANLDRVILPIDDRGPGILEIKTTSSYKALNWKSDAPLAPQVQLHHYLAVTGFKWGSIAVLVGGQQLIWIDYDRNDLFIEALLREEAKFWDRIERKDPPEPDALPATTEALKALYPQESGETMELPPEAAVWAHALETAKSFKKTAEESIIEYENKIKALMKDATWGIAPSGEKFSYKHWERPAYEVKANSGRTLRRIKGGGK
jgi:putative phage-type endonuclease|tara:strand:+ start:2265 stop:3173 length:909 start_codon:yes stop_codon:yes gene_type:complete